MTRISWRTFGIFAELDALTSGLAYGSDQELTFVPLKEDVKIQIDNTCIIL